MLVNSLKDHAVLLLDPDGRILTWNAGAERIYIWLPGRGGDGDEFSPFLSPEDQERGKMQNTFKEATLNGFWEEEGWQGRKEGAVFWAEW